MNKKAGLFLSALFLSSFLIGIVSAAEWGFSSSGNIGDMVVSAIDGFVQVINPVAKYLLGDTTTAENLFAKSILFIILLSVVYLALKNIGFFSEKGWAHWLISIAVSILSIRFLGNDLVRTIILPYSTLGIAMGAAFPFVIWFIVINRGLAGGAYRTIRKVAWIFFAVIFIGLWVARDVGSAGQIYLWTALAAIIMLFLDGTIQRLFGSMKLERSLDVRTQKLIREKARDLQQVDQDYADGLMTEADHTREAERLRKQIAYLESK